ncbi:Repetin [Streptomyces sp. G44]|uniref:Repetin n=1 Tax=Streptomyces sp. G44 TaxID=2807632 RepID=UPI0019615D0C|nr:Repetin [Streptomyces sp. G44]MBM7172558.1 Repetin [Streptomyces sp. G44]
MSRTTIHRVLDRRSALAVGAALLVTAGAAGAAVASGDEASRPTTSAAAPHTADEAAEREAAALTGTAKMYRKTTEDVTFTFDAHLAAENNGDPSKATGTFRFVHLDKPGGKGGWAKGRIDCLMTGGKVATATGIITATNLKDVKGGRVGFTVHDTGGTDRVGYSWAAVGGPDGTKKLPKCTSSAPHEKVRKGTGDFDVTPWKVPYPKAP